MDFFHLQLDAHIASTSSQPAALIIEPVVQGAAGMIMNDLEYQRALVRVCKERNIPVRWLAVCDFRINSM